MGISGVGEGMEELEKLTATLAKKLEEPLADADDTSSEPLQ